MLFSWTIISLWVQGWIQHFSRVWFVTKMTKITIWPFDHFDLWKNVIFLWKNVQTMKQCSFCKFLWNEFLSGYKPESSSYPTTAGLLFEWMEGENCDRVDGRLRRRMRLFESKQELSRSFIDNEAIFHKLCLNRYDRHKLKRKLQTEPNCNRQVMKFKLKKKPNTIVPCFKDV